MDDADELPEAHVALVVESGRGEPKRFVFDSSQDRRVIIGRSPGVDVPIMESMSSRKHAMLIHQWAVWMLHDLGSTNGTVLRGRRIEQPARIEVGDVIAIGRTSIRIVSLGSSPAKHTSPLAAVKLAVDLEAGEASIDGELIPLSAAELVWFAFLAVHRKSGTDWVVTGRDGHEALRSFFESLEDRTWTKDQRTRTLAALARGEDVDDEDLKNLRGKTVQKLKRWCTGVRAGLAAFILPEIDGRNRQRLPIAPESIILAGVTREAPE